MNCLGYGCMRQQSQPYDISTLSQEWDLNSPALINYHLFLTPAEIEMISEKWNHLTQQGKYKDVGCIFFERFFMYAPDTKHLFFTLDDNYTSKRDWQRHPLFLSHVRRVINSIDMAILLLDRPDELEAHLKQNREYHQRIIELRKSHIQMFIKIFEDVVATMLNKMYTEENKVAYRKFFTKIYVVMSQDLSE